MVWAGVGSLYLSPVVLMFSVARVCLLFLGISLFPCPRFFGSLKNGQISDLPSQSQGNKEGNGEKHPA